MMVAVSSPPRICRMIMMAGTASSNAWMIPIGGGRLRSTAACITSSHATAAIRSRKVNRAGDVSATCVRADGVVVDIVNSSILGRDGVPAADALGR